MPSRDAIDLTEALRGVAERVFPRDARIIAPPGEGDFVLLASWKVNDDPERPSKRSKTVRIMVSEEAVEDYRSGVPGERLNAQRRFEAWLRAKVAGFDPRHDRPLGHEPPVEGWPIGTLELNG